MGKRKKYKMTNVEFVKGTEWDAWDGVKTFWRAQIWTGSGYALLATLCRTKKECVAEARQALEALNRKEMS